MLFGQSLLKKEVTLEPEKVALERALEQLANEGKFKLSYSSDYIPSDSLVKPLPLATVQQHLQHLILRPVKYKVSGEFIIILPAEKRAESVVKISGFVENKVTHERIANATVYDPNKYYATLTDNSGFYTLKVSSKNDLIPISISKDNYFDTVILVRPKQNITVNATIKPLVIEKVKSPEIASLRGYQNFRDLNSVKLFVPAASISQAQNISYTINRPAQVSFLPAMGSNRGMSGVVTNHVSFNVLAGYSAGVDGIEIGSVVNIVRRDVNGFQLGGFGNVVGGNVSGIQVAGMFNNVRGSTSGIQVGGFQNICLDTLHGVQVGGFFNFLSGKMEGVQVGGFTNICASNVEGWQVAGFGNWAQKEVSMVQVGGFFNTAIKRVDGLQIAGFTNYCGESVNGLQVAGFGNVAIDSVGGVQLSGFFNYARQVEFGQVSSFLNVASGTSNGLQLSGGFNFANRMNGIQVGVFNICRHAKGVPFGLVSVVLDGYHALSAATTDVLTSTVSVRTGVDRFYNIFSFGFDSKKWGYAYGVGNRKQWGKHLGRAWELNFWQIHPNGNLIFESNLLSRLNYKLTYRTGFLTLEAGAVYNLQTMATNIPEARIYAPYSYHSLSAGNTAFISWPGFTAGLSITLP
ncbi:hypothetical protein GC194_07830 [bacterium]|nr:hypothetical protein [bacterium]